MIYLPMSVDELNRLHDHGELAAVTRAFSVTRDMCEAFELTTSMAEDAQHAVQVFASLSCLLAGRDRLVVAAEMDVRALVPGEEAEFGEVVAPRLAWSDVEALFADDDQALPQMRAYAAEHAGQSLERAWDDAATGRLLGEHDLLWYAPSECRALVERLSAETDRD